MVRWAGEEGANDGERTKGGASIQELLRTMTFRAFCSSGCRTLHDVSRLQTFIFPESGEKSRGVALGKTLG